MKKKDQKAQEKIKRDPRNIKDYLPSNLLNIRKNTTLKIPSNSENLPARNFSNLLEPIKLFPDWPSEEEIKVLFDKKL